MKKDSVRGWKDVFRFTMTQTLKSKAYIVTMVIMIMIAMVSMPIMNIIMKDGTMSEPEQTALEKVYFYNATLYQGMDVKSEFPAVYGQVVVENATEDIEKLQTRIQEEEQNNVILVLAEDEEYCYIQFLRCEDGGVSNYELQLLGQYVQSAYTKTKVKNLGLTEDEMKYFETSVVSSSSIVDTESALVLEDTSITEGEYWFMYGMMFVVLMVCVMSSSQVASSIVQEKSSKVIEYLLTSIRPLAIIVGKVLATLVTVMVQLVSLVAAAFVSVKLGELISGEKGNVITQFMTPEMLESLNLVNVILGLVVAGAGIVLYATLAGLCGATASRMEDANESLTLLTMTSLVGFYIGFGAAGTLMATGENAFVTFALIFPVSSSFLLPAALLVGKASFMVAIISILVLFVSIILMFLFVSKVYEGLILHNGNRLKIKDVLTMAKGGNTKKVKKGENA